MMVQATKHSKRCREVQRENARAWADFGRTFPDYCRKCEGQGGSEYPGYFNYQTGVGCDPVFDECHECIGQLKCPVCGCEMSEEEWDRWEEAGSWSQPFPCGHTVHDPVVPYVYDCQGECCYGDEE